MCQFVESVTQSQKIPTWKLDMFTCKTCTRDPVAPSFKIVIRLMTGLHIVQNHTRAG